MYINSQSFKRYYAKKVAEHKCVNCGKPLPEGYTKRRCPVCNDKTNKYWQEFYKGRCRDCRKFLPPNYEYATCKSCRVKRSQKYYAKKEKLNDNRSNN